MKTFITFKSGKFYFCDKFDESGINKLLWQAIVLNETIVDLPILPELADRLGPEIMYSSIAGTALIEGNPINEEDVGRIVRGEDVEGYTQKDKQEILNLINAYDFLSRQELSGKQFMLSEALIKNVHKIITLGVDHENNVPGQYRNGKVYVGDKVHGGRHTPPKILADIKNLMKEYVLWINSKEILKLDPFLRAALAHYHFCLIHPFWDGNGRTARLLEAMILQCSGVKYAPKELSNYYYRNVDEYYRVFAQSIKLKKDVTSFVEYVLKGAVESLQRIKKEIIFFIRKLALRDYYAFGRRQKDLTKRQFDLLNLLLDEPVVFTLKELYSEYPFAILYGRATTQTARRDLKRLVEMNLLSVAEDKKYRLNFHAIG